jgi:hypothetical protein
LLVLFVAFFRPRLVTPCPRVFSWDPLHKVARKKLWRGRRSGEEEERLRRRLGRERAAAEEKDGGTVGTVDPT